MPNISKQCVGIAIATVFKLNAALTGAMAVACLLVSFAADAGNLYRYVNDRGVTVIDFRVPADYAKKGYEVLNEQGRVIDVVPRQLSEDERSDASTARELAAQAKADKIRLQQWDESLLLRYSTIEDIESARDRSLRDLKIRVSILKSNQRSLRQRVENGQARVAEAERSGRSPSEQDLTAIADLKDEIDYTEKAIADRQVEIERVSDQYQRDIDRFSQLQEVVELRRSLETPTR